MTTRLSKHFKTHIEARACLVQIVSNDINALFRMLPLLLQSLYRESLHPRLQL